jgi:hypothetical protein
MWREHLRPWLSVREAVQLRGACKALKGLVMGWPMPMGERSYEKVLPPKNLEAALTCFPAAESLAIRLNKPLARAEESRMVEVLRGHGGTIKRVIVYEPGARRILESAVLAGALPNLTHFSFYLWYSTHREILSGGMLRLLEKVEVNIHQAEQVAALQHLRHLPQLRRLEVFFRGAQIAVFPPFIPPALRSLYLYDEDEDNASVKSLLQALPRMLRASGAGLEEIDLICPEHLSAEDGAALGQVLRTCSVTLKTVMLHGPLEGLSSACLRELVPGLVSCCATLKVLHCHWTVFSALPATCPAFPRLNELSLEGGEDDAINLASPAWDIVANGRLPALATLDISSEGDFFLSYGEGEGASEGAGRLARAFEAVGGTLRRFHLTRYGGDTIQTYEGSYELGAAVGKLRRLRYLQLSLCRDGGGYHPLGRGLAASGGCPELFHVEVKALRNRDLLTCEPSLILPSVRDLSIIGYGLEEEEALLLCCGLVQVGYKHLLRIPLRGFGPPALTPSVIACMKAIVSGGGMLAIVE